MRVLFCLCTAILFAGCHHSKTETVETVPYFNWESASVQSNGIRLHYWRTGHSGRQVIIMSHGITDYGLNWATLASKLEQDYDLIMYDSRGHGFSEKPEGPYDLNTHVEDLAGLIRALNIEKPILIGHSMGGSIVGKTAATYPDLPLAVIMEDPPMEEMLETLTEAIIPDWKNWVNTQRHMPKADLMKAASKEFHPGWTPFLYDQWAESKHLVSPNVVDILPGEGFGNPRDYFQHITVPALILKADAEAPLRKRHLEAAALLPNGRLVHIDGAGHVIRNDKPEEVENQIRLFLSSL